MSSPTAGLLDGPQDLRRGTRIVSRCEPPPPACVIGDLSLVRALGKAGVPVIGCVPKGSAVAHSKYCVGALELPDVVHEPTAAVAALIDYATRQPQPPVLFYQGDHDLLMVCRHREELAAHFRFLIPREPLVEDTVDKLRFSDLAIRYGLPTPPTMVLRRATISAEQVARWQHFPAVLKPSTRADWFDSPLLEGASGSQGKAIAVADRQALERILPLIQSHGTDCVLQACVEGGEDRVVSYHAYVREGGQIVAEFTGAKIRTSPRVYGLSSFLTLTDDAQVRDLGRRCLYKMGFAGVVKLDFKRDHRTQQLFLLEANVRFSLWHHLGAAAGVNIPYLVYRDLIGEPVVVDRPIRPRAAVRWMALRKELRAVREHRRARELSWGSWLRDVLSADIQEDLSLTDPAPNLMELATIVTRRLPWRRQTGS